MSKSKSGSDRTSATHTRNGNGSRTPASNDAAASLTFDLGALDSECVRTTVALPETVLLNLSIWCARNKLRRNEGIVQILAQFLVSEGLQPDKSPKEIIVSY